MSVVFIVIFLFKMFSCCNDVCFSFPDYTVHGEFGVNRVPIPGLPRCQRGQDGPPASPVCRMIARRYPGSQRNKHGKSSQGNSQW